MTDKVQPKERRWMILPYNPAYPNFNEVHRENDWCAKAGCSPVCDKNVVAGKEPQRKKKARRSGPEQESKIRLPYNSRRVPQPRLARYGEHGRNVDHPHRVPGEHGQARKRSIHSVR